MPRKAARHWLEVTKVRVERPSDISEADAKAEGCEMEPGGMFPKYQKHPVCGEVGWDDAKEWFQDLWYDINGEETWNYWCFAYDFKRIKKPQ